MNELWATAPERGLGPNSPVMPLNESRQFDYDCVGKGCYRGRLPGFDRLNDRMPGKMRLTDVDGMLELGGRFFFLEWKAYGGDLPDGQRIAFKKLSQYPGVDVVIARERDTLSFEVLWFRGGTSCTGTPAASVLGKGWEVWSNERFYDWFDQWVAIAMEARRNGE